MPSLLPPVLAEEEASSGSLLLRNKFLFNNSSSQQKTSNDTVMSKNSTKSSQNCEFFWDSGDLEHFALHCFALCTAADEAKAEVSDETISDAQEETCQYKPPKQGRITLDTSVFSKPGAGLDHPCGPFPT